MKKELLISAKFDTQDFDKSVEKMQSKLKTLYTPSDTAKMQKKADTRMAAMGIQNPRGPLQKEEFNQTYVQTRKDLDTYVKSELKNQEKLAKAIADRGTKLQSLKEKEKDVSKTAKEDVRVQDKLTKMVSNRDEKVVKLRKEEGEAVKKAKSEAADKERIGDMVTKKETKVRDLKKDEKKAFETVKELKKEEKKAIQAEKQAPKGTEAATKASEATAKAKDDSAKGAKDLLAIKDKIVKTEENLGRLKFTHKQADEQSAKSAKEAMELQGKIFRFEDNTNRIKELAKIQQKEVAKSTKEELDIKSKIGRVEENNVRLKDLHRQREGVIGQALDARRKVTPQSWGELKDSMKDRGIWNTMKDIPGAFKANSAGMVGGALGAVGSATILGGGLYNTMKQSQSISEQARGSAISGTAGQDLSKVYNGKSAFEAQWMRERSQASGMAADQAKGNKGWDLSKIFGGIATGVGGGAIAGSVVPGLGTAVGAVGGGLAAAGGLMMGDRTRERMLGMLPGSFGDAHKKRYDALIASQQAEDKDKNYEALKQQDPQKRAVLEKFEAEREGDLDTQRTLGLNDKGLNKMKKSATESGFMPEQVSGMAKSIVGAGGSARMGQEGAFGAKMERAGLTNAPAVLGTLSSSIQSSEANKRATISIMSEAFKIGLDNTDFAEENRRFTQSAANIISKSGASSAEDQEKIVAKLGSYLGERTNRGVEAAGNAYERDQTRGSQVGGRRGAIRFTEAMKSPTLGKFNTGDLTELLAARPDQLTTNSPFMRSYADQAKTSPETILKELKKVTDASRFLVPGRRNEAEGIRGKLNDYMKENKIDSTQFAERAKIKKGEPNALPEEQVSQYGKLQRLISEENKEGFNQFEGEADTQGYLNSDIMAKPAPSKKKAEEALEQTGDRIGDKFQTANASGADQAREAFMKLYDTISENISKTKELNDAAGKAADSLNNIANTGRSELPRGSATNQEILKPLMQPQANKPR